MPIRMIVVDDHWVIRSGLRQVFEDTDIEIIAETSRGAEAVEIVSATECDLVLLDIRIPGEDGFTTLGQIKHENPKMGVLVFSAYENPSYIARTISLGASGYILKGQTVDVLDRAIRKVASGESVWTREELRRVTGALATPRLELDAQVPLTQRESEVLRQMVLGQTNKKIAVSLGISYETVKEHVQHILRKVGVSDRTQAAVWAFRKGIA